MRIYAIDYSGSAEMYAGAMLNDVKRRSTSDHDGVVFFSHGNVSRGQMVNAATLDSRARSGGDGLDDLLEWMDQRSFHPSDELIIYHDGFIPFESLEKISDYWFKTKFVLMGCFITENDKRRKDWFVKNNLLLDTVEL